MPKQEATRWRKDKSPELEDKYLQLERIIDLFLLRGENKIVQDIERQRMVCEGDLEKMTELCKEFAEIAWSAISK